MRIRVIKVPKQYQDVGTLEIIQNAKKWHHAFGGDIMTHGANFDTGITLVGNGGTQ